MSYVVLELGRKINTSFFTSTKKKPENRNCDFLKVKHQQVHASVQLLSYQDGNPELCTHMYLRSPPTTG